MALSIKGEELKGIQRTEALIELGESLNDWSLIGGRASYDAFREYVWSKHATLPFSGGFLEQPAWIRDDFITLRNLLNYHYLNEDLKE